VKRGLKLAGYFLFFDICFVVAAVVTFPLQGLRPLIVDQAEKALGKGKQGKSGVDPVVTIGELGMSGLGVKAERVQVQLGSTDPEPGPIIDLDAVRVSASLASIVSSTKTLQLDADLYQGEVSADVSVDDKQNVVAADIEVDGIELGRIGAIIAGLGAPVEGKISADIDVVMGGAPEKEAKGTVDVRIAQLSVGPGNLKVVPGGFELAEPISLGTLAIKAPIDKGQGQIEGRFEGTSDIEAALDGTITMRAKLQTSRLDADGWFRPTALFLDKNPKIKSAIELGEKLSLPGAPSLSKAKDGEGRYHFEARGALQTLKPQLSRDAGRRAARKRASTAGAPPPTDMPTPPVAGEKPRPARPEQPTRPGADDGSPYNAADIAVQENAAQEKAVQEKAAQEKAAQEKIEQEKIEQEKIEQEKAEQKKAAAEKTDTADTADE
jgi:type II secretion system protein N